MVGYRTNAHFKSPGGGGDQYTRESKNNHSNKTLQWYGELVAS